MMKPRLLTLLLLWLLVLPVQANESTSNCSSGPNLSSLGAEQQIQLVYVGLLSRAADAPGLNYWINNLNDGFSIEKLRENIVCCQAEYLNGLGNLNRSDLVTSLYQNLFNRSPRDDGKAYWVSGGGSNVSADRLVLALINGAGCTDQYALLNKAEAASYYTSNYTTYDKTEAASAVSDVDSTEASLQAAKDLIDSLGSTTPAGYVCLTSSAFYYGAASSVVEMKNGTQLNNYSGRTWSPSNTLLIFRTSSARWYALDIYGAYQYPPYEIFRVDVLVPPQTCFEPDLYEITRIKEETGLPTVGGGDEYFYSRDGVDVGSIKTRSCSIKVGATVYIFEADEYRRPVMLDVESGRDCEGTALQ